MTKKDLKLKDYFEKLLGSQVKITKKLVVIESTQSNEDKLKQASVLFNACGGVLFIQKK